MAQLSIEWNEIGDEGAQAFATALHKIDRLRLCLCAIKDPGVVALAGALQRREAPVIVTFSKCLRVFRFMFLTFLCHFCCH